MEGTDKIIREVLKNSNTDVLGFLSFYFRKALSSANGLNLQ